MAMVMSVDMPINNISCSSSHNGNGNGNTNTNSNTNTNTNSATLGTAEEGTPLLASPSKDRRYKTPSRVGTTVGSSSVSATVFTLTNSVVGAGCIALGSAIGRSGGLASIVAISFFAALNKLSFDLVIDLSCEAAAGNATGSGAGETVPRTTASYESLGQHAYGRHGRAIVTVSKLIYSYGAMVVYIKIIKDNFTSGAVQLYAMSGMPPSSVTAWATRHEDAVTVLMGLAVILPVCLLRNMSAMERCSIAKVAILFSLLFTMMYLMSSSDYADSMELTSREKWLEVRPGFARSLGSFVFTFVSQHTINLTYESLRPELRTMRCWQAVSTFSILLSASISLALGLVLYVTFWTDASSNMFSLYPAPSTPVALAQLLLSLMIMFTYPVTFLACRELCTPPPRRGGKAWWLLETDSRQLAPAPHVAVTLVLWSSTTALALLATSLLDAVDLVGSAAGTLIAFVLPGAFSWRMRGPTALAAVLLVVGGSVGVSGTCFSLAKLVGVGDDQ